MCVLCTQTGMIQKYGINGHFGRSFLRVGKMARIKVACVRAHTLRYSVIIMILVLER